MGERERRHHADQRPEAPPPQDQGDDEGDVLGPADDVLQARAQVVPHDLQDLRTGLEQRRFRRTVAEQGHAPQIPADGDHVARCRIHLMKQRDPVDQGPGERRATPAHLHQHVLAPRTQRLHSTQAGAAGVVGQPCMLENVGGERGCCGVQPLGCDRPIGRGQAGTQRDFQVAAVELQQHARRVAGQLHAGARQLSRVRPGDQRRKQQARKQHEGPGTLAGH